MRVRDQQAIVDASQAVANGQSLRRLARRIAYGPQVRTGFTTTPRRDRFKQARKSAAFAAQSRRVNR